MLCLVTKCRFPLRSHGLDTNASETILPLPAAEAPTKVRQRLRASLNLVRRQTIGGFIDLMLAEGGIAYKLGLIVCYFV